MARPNAYAVGAADDAFDAGEQQTGRYAVPGVERDAPYADYPGWSPTLRTGDIPDGTRIMVQPRRDFRPEPDRPPEEFWGRIDADTSFRHSGETVDADGWEEYKGGSGKSAAPDPRRNPPAEPRPTTRMAPRSYSFTRLFDQLRKGNGARQLNGIHFSMADHRREYPILGMAPVTSRRNTYRIDPSPWDADIVDRPADVEPTIIPATIQAVDVPPSPNRSWRL